jgi:hypothetical protein
MMAESNARGALALLLMCGGTMAFASGARAEPLAAALPRPASAFARPAVLPLATPATDSLPAPAAAAPAGYAGAGADKFQHASLSAATGVGAGVLTRSSVAALAVPLALGVAKELRDRRHTRFDALDLAADAVGALAAAAITAALVRD